jgi:IS30 family transposase
MHMTYHQLTLEERRIASQLRFQGKSSAEIGRILGRDRSTVSREFRRNRHFNGRWRYYTFSKAHEKAMGRRFRSRRNRRFDAQQWSLVEERLAMDWSPEQISATLRMEGLLSISHETIYMYIWADRRRGGRLHHHLRQIGKRRRKRYGTYESRGRLAGKRMITERPPAIERRNRRGHWEIDTVMGTGSNDCIVTMVERKSGYLEIGKVTARTTEKVNRETIELMSRQHIRVKTITSDNGTEFHGYKEIERATGTRFYFANPHHSWERGTNENTNGLIRQYLPKGTSMRYLTQAKCDMIANHLNERPRKRLGFRTPKECYAI